MGLEFADGSAARFSSYIESLGGVIGHADRVNPLRDYCMGLMMPGSARAWSRWRRVTAPARMAAQHQSLLHFVGQAAWSDERCCAKVRETGAAGDRAAGPIEAWIVDDTGLSRRRASIRSAWRGSIAGSSASRTIARWRSACRWRTSQASLPVAYRLYLPKRGRRMPSAGARRACRRRSSSRPSRRSRSTQIRAALAAGRAARRGAGGCRLRRRHGLPDGLSELGLDLCRRRAAAR